MNIGDMWAQSWGRLDQFTRPYPSTDELNPTSAMINQVNNIHNTIILVYLTINFKNTCIFIYIIFNRFIFTKSVFYKNNNFNWILIELNAIN
jgi:hypothetical protein